MLQRLESVALLEPTGLITARADQHNAVGGGDHAGEEIRSQIAARADRYANSFDHAEDVRQKSAVEQHVARVGVEGAKRRIIMVADQVVDVWRHHMGETIRAERGGNPEETVNIIVIE